MSKEKLQKIITENFINGKIGVNKYIKMSEKVENISEKKSEEIITEINWKAVAVVGGVSLMALLSIWAEIMDRKKRFNEEWKKCKDKCAKIYEPKIKKAKNLEDEDDISDIKELYENCKDKCSDIYYKKQEELKKKQIEVKNKINKAKAEIKRRKSLASKKK